MKLLQKCVQHIAFFPLDFGMFVVSLKNFASKYNFYTTECTYLFFSYLKFKIYYFFLI